jgi:hypothetical protein
MEWFFCYTKTFNQMNVQTIFDRLWDQYSTENPSVKKIHQLFEKQGESIVNDHVAFRTFDDSRLNIDVLAKPFILAGYKEAGQYHFPAKKLFARHFEMEGQPRVFISQLLLSEFSNELQDRIKRLIDEVDRSVLEEDWLIVEGSIFGTPSFGVYEALREESEYAAWVYAYGFRANHFTVSINHLENFESIQAVNTFLKNNGFELNSSGGEIKGSPEKLLEQSSTLADRIKLDFEEGSKEIPSCYYEFALRYPEKDGKLFSGFIAGSADKIFESTDFR